MKDRASGADERIEGEGRDIVRIELPREACEVLSELCAHLADMIADDDCGCEFCEERFAQAEAWEGVFRGMAVSEPGAIQEIVVGQGEYVN